MKRPTIAAMKMYRFKRMKFIRCPPKDGRSMPSMKYICPWIHNWSATTTKRSNKDVAVQRAR